MDAASRWPAVRRLRAWERDRLDLHDGETLLDVGCGPGDAGVALVAASGGAKLLGLDASELMLAVARQRAAAAGVTAEFGIGDAQKLPYDSGTVDALRSERTLQWLPDPTAALAEYVRVLEPGGRLVVTDTDWDSLTMDLPDRRDFEAMRAAARAFRGHNWAMGRELLNRCRETGLADLACTAATHVVTGYDPGEPIAETGIPPLGEVAGALAAGGLLDPAAAERLILQIELAGKADRTFLSLTMYAVYGVKPGTP